MIVCYGEGGPALDNRCPECGRFMKMPESLSYKINTITGIMTINPMCLPKCKKCGRQQPEHIGWSDEFIQ